MFPFNSSTNLSQAGPRPSTSGTSSGIRRHRQRYAQMFRWQTAGHTVGPFDQANPAALKVFLHTEVRELGRVSKPVGVEVIDRQPHRVFLHQNEGRTGDNATVEDAQTLGDGPCELGLARSQIADQGDDGTRPQTLTEAPAEHLRRGEIGQVENHRGSWFVPKKAISSQPDRLLRAESYYTAFSTRQVLLPPKPNELDTADAHRRRPRLVGDVAQLAFGVGIVAG